MLRELLALRPLLRELRLIRRALERLAEGYEASLAEQGVMLRQVKGASPDDTEVLYQDEEREFLREWQEQHGSGGRQE